MWTTCGPPRISSGPQKIPVVCLCFDKGLTPYCFSTCRSKHHCFPLHQGCPTYGPRARMRPADKFHPARENSSHCRHCGKNLHTVCLPLITKRSKPFSDGEFEKECFHRVADATCPEKKEQFAKISLSRQTIARKFLARENF